MKGACDVMIYMDNAATTKMHPDVVRAMLPYMGNRYGNPSGIYTFSKNIKKDSMVLDLGTGTGIIPILLCGKTKLKKVTGIELQEEVAKMAKKSIKLNNLEDKFNVINENILNLNKY